MTDNETNDRIELNDEEEQQEGLLTLQTEGLDKGETSAIAGPDWDEDMVQESEQDSSGETLEGEVEK